MRYKSFALVSCLAATLGQSACKKQSTIQSSLASATGPVDLCANPEIAPGLRGLEFASEPGVLVMHLRPDPCGVQRTRGGFGLTESRYKRVVFYVAFVLDTNVTPGDVGKLNEPAGTDVTLKAGDKTVVLPNRYSNQRTPVDGLAYPSNYQWIVKDHNLAEQYARERLHDVLWVRVNNPQRGDLEKAWRNTLASHPEVADPSIEKTAIIYSHGGEDDKGRLVFVREKERINKDGTYSEQKEYADAGDVINELANAVNGQTRQPKPVDFAIHACYATAIHCEQDVRSNPNVGAIITGSKRGTVYVGQKTSETNPFTSPMVQNLLKYWENPQTVPDVDQDNKKTLKDVAAVLQEHQTRPENSWDSYNYSFYVTDNNGAMTWLSTGRSPSEEVRQDQESELVDYGGQKAKLVNVIIDGRPQSVYMATYRKPYFQTVEYSDGATKQAPINQIVSGRPVTPDGRPVQPNSPDAVLPASGAQPDRKP